MRFLLPLLLLFILRKGGNGSPPGVVAPVKGPVTSPFGMRTSPTTGQPAFHNGVDIAVPVGTPIVSPMDGVVATLFTTNAGGLQTVIQHPDGFISGYAHLDSVKFGPGVNVTQGKVIAESGASGSVTGPHLHFSLRYGDSYVNPQEYFSFA